MRSRPTRSITSANAVRVSRIAIVIRVLEQVAADRRGACSRRPTSRCRRLEAGPTTPHRAPRESHSTALRHSSAGNPAAATARWESGGSRRRQVTPDEEAAERWRVRSARRDRTRETAAGQRQAGAALNFAASASVWRARTSAASLPTPTKRTAERQPMTRVGFDAGREYPAPSPPPGFDRPLAHRRSHVGMRVVAEMPEIRRQIARTDEEGRRHRRLRQSRRCSRSA